MNKITATKYDLYTLALGFAACAHKDQKRKYTQEPYIRHCQAVAVAVADFIDDDEVLAAAVMHDTIEDTKVTFEDISLMFSPRIAHLVQEVTDASKPEDGNREARKAIDRAHLAKSSPEGATIKLADLIDNTSTIVKYDKDFAQIYLREKEALLPLLKHGNNYLWLRAQETLRRALLTLGLGEKL